MPQFEYDTKQDETVVELTSKPPSSAQLLHSLQDHGLRDIFAKESRRNLHIALLDVARKPPNLPRYLDKF